MNMCSCGRGKIDSHPFSIALLRAFFNLIAEKHPLYLLCDECGEEILRGYKDPYGIGV